MGHDWQPDPDYGPGSKSRGDPLWNYGPRILNRRTSKGTPSKDIAPSKVTRKARTLLKSHHLYSKRRTRGFKRHQVPPQPDPSFFPGALPLRAPAQSVNLTYVRSVQIVP